MPSNLLRNRPIRCNGARVASASPARLPCWSTRCNVTYTGWFADGLTKAQDVR